MIKIYPIFNVIFLLKYNPYISLHIPGSRADEEVIRIVSTCGRHSGGDQSIRRDTKRTWYMFDSFLFELISNEHFHCFQNQISDSVPAPFTSNVFLLL